MNKKYSKEELNYLRYYKRMLCAIIGDCEKEFGKFKTTKDHLNLKEQIDEMVLYLKNTCHIENIIEEIEKRRIR